MTTNHNLATGHPAGEVVISSCDLIETNEANDKGLIPRRKGRKRSRTELWAMRTRGRMNAHGERVVLRTIVEGRTVYTTADWINDYFASFAAGLPAPPSPRECRRRSYANRNSTPQISLDAVATLRKHGLAGAAGVEASP